MIDLIAIRARDEDDYATAEVLRNIQWAGNTDPELTATINMVADRHALLGYVDTLTTLVRAQAEDEGLWFQAATAPEVYLQDALRRLHHAIEGTTP